MVIQQLINGLSIGSVYAMIAVGYSIVYSVLNFSNFAHGEILMLGSYIGFFALTKLGLPFSVALGCSIVGAGIIAMLIEKIGYRPLRFRNAPPLYLMITAMGFSVFLQNLSIITLSPNFRTFPYVFSLKPYTIGNVTIGKLDSMIFILTAVALTLLTIFIYRSKLGTAIRATSYNPRVASLMGINPDFVIAIVFMLAGGTAGLGGVLFGMKYTAYPWMGVLTIKAFIAAVVGGLGSLPGAVLGALLLGVTETFAAGYVSSSFRDLFAFTLMIIIIVLRPGGLLGSVTQEKA
jgi:branched-chain amino acid transport system permease protein